MRKAILFLIPCYLFFIPVYPAYAQSGFSVGISPPILEIIAVPPAYVEAKINLRNESDRNQVFDISFAEFISKSSSNGQLTYIDARAGGPYSALKGKIKITDGDSQVQRIALEPSATKGLKLKIDIDSSVAPGDYYFSVLFISEGSQANQDKSSSDTGGGIATNVILTVGNKGPTSGSIDEFSVPFFLSSGPVPFKLLLQNTSSHYIQPRGRISIYDMFGRDVGRVDILPQYILAGSKRYMTDYSAASQNGVLIWPQKFIFGIYTATAVVKLTDEGPTFTRSIYFVSGPLHILFTISFFAFILMGIYIKVRRKI